MRPWTSWPSPGMKKLARAAMTFPESPRREGLAVLLMVGKKCFDTVDTREMGGELQEKGNTEFLMGLYYGLCVCSLLCVLPK